MDPSSPRDHAVDLADRALARCHEPPLAENASFRRRDDALPGDESYVLTAAGAAPLVLTFNDFAFQIDVDPLSEVAVVPAERFDDPASGVTATALLFLTSTIRLTFTWGGRRARIETVDGDGRVTSSTATVAVGGRLKDGAGVVEYPPAFATGDPD